MRFADALIEIEAALPKVTWRKLEDKPAEMPASFVAYDGSADGWRFLACTWIQNCDPPTDRTYDGTATKGGLVLHLTLDLSIKAVKLAEDQCAS
jgi:hypothetical protein